MEVRFAAVPFRIVAGGFNGLRVDVGAGHAVCAQLLRSDRKNARAAAVIEHVVGGLQVFVEPVEAEARRRVRTRTEGDARVKTDDDGIGRGRFAPGRNDPEPGRHVGRLELRLSDAHPVLVLDVARFKKLRRFAAGLRDRGVKRSLEVEAVGSQNGDDRARPGLRLRLETRLAVKRLLVGAVGIGVLEGGRERAGIKKQIRNFLSGSLVGEDSVFTHDGSSGRPVVGAGYKKRKKEKRSR